MLKLRQYRDRVRSEGAPMPDFSHLVREQQDDGERRLLMHSPEIIALLEQTPAFDRGQIQLTLETITRGQELDLKRFGDGSKLSSLQTAEDLDDYTYHVAGCVGEFWTRLTRRHCFPDAELDDSGFSPSPSALAKPFNWSTFCATCPEIWPTDAVICRP